MGTSLGLVYVLDARGETREGFPVQVGEVQGHVAVGDLTGDGALEMVAADMRGNVVVINGAGETVWDRHLPGSLPQGATLGDVDGDGSVDVVVATTAGAVYALRGDDGSTLPHFPVRVGDKVRPIAGQRGQDGVAVCGVSAFPPRASRLALHASAAATGVESGHVGEFAQPHRPGLRRRRRARGRRRSSPSPRAASRVPGL